MIATAGLVALLANLIAATAIPPHALQRSHASARAVYFMSNNDAGNQIYALPVDDSGLVSDGSVTSTGGLGASVKADYPGDSLASQGCMQIHGNVRTAPNFASTVKFGADICFLEAVCCQLWVQFRDYLRHRREGSYEAYSRWAARRLIGRLPKLHRHIIQASDRCVVCMLIGIMVQLTLQSTACVSNTGHRANIMCFRMTEQGLEPYDETPRPVTLDPVQSDPVKGPPNTVSQVLFNYDDSALISMIKGDPTAKPPTVGYVSYFPIQDGDISRDETRSTPEGTEGGLFGSQALPNGNIFATDFTFGTVMLGVDEKGVVSTISKYSIPHNGATCWVTQSALTNTLYTTDAGHNYVAGFSPETGKPIASSTQNGTSDPGVSWLDNGVPSMNAVVASGDLLYAISPGVVSPDVEDVPPHVVVMKQVGQSGVQSLQAFSPRVPAGSKLTFHINGLAVLEY